MRLNPQCNNWTRSNTRPPLWWPFSFLWISNVTNLIETQKKGLNMTELLDKLLTALVGQTSNPVITLLLIAVGYLGWTNYRLRQDQKEEVKEYKETIDKLQTNLNTKTGEERETLLSIIEKYHQSQIGIKEAISEVKSVLSTLAALSQRGA